MIAEGELDREAPGCREAIYDPRWPEWLRWIDPATGMRRSMLLRAIDRAWIMLPQQFIATDGWMPPPRPAAGKPMYSPRADRPSAPAWRMGG
jgi:hypothetical protein